MHKVLKCNLWLLLSVNKIFRIFAYKFFILNQKNLKLLLSQGLKNIMIFMSTCMSVVDIGKQLPVYNLLPV